MLSGSVSMNFYTTPRMTRDIDIVILIGINDIDKIVSIFNKDYYIDKDMVINAVTNQSMFNIIHLQEVIKVDFIVRRNEEYRILEFKNRKKVILDGVEISIVSLEDLIISKIFWSKESNSENQIRDIKNLIKIKYDMDYVELWCKKLNVFDHYERILNDK